MINQDFKLDFIHKTITHQGEGKNIYSLVELYSYLQDVFDEPENMEHAIPILAKSKTEFTLVNGWTMDARSREYVQGNLT